MSSFMVSEDTLGRILYHIERSGKLTELTQVSEHVLDPMRCPHWSFDFQWQTAVDALQTINIAALKVRYGDRLDTWETELWPVSSIIREPATDIEVYKALSCLTYQCCEGDLHMRPLYTWLEAYRKNLAEAIVSDTKEYALAPWE